MIAHRQSTIKKRSERQAVPFAPARSKIKHSVKVNLIKGSRIKYALKKAISIKRKLTRSDIEKSAMFADICKSDSFTVEAAYKDFAFISLKGKNL